MQFIEHTLTEYQLNSFPHNEKDFIENYLLKVKTRKTSNLTIVRMKSYEEILNVFNEHNWQTN